MMLDVVQFAAVTLLWAERFTGGLRKNSRLMRTFQMTPLRATQRRPWPVTHSDIQ